MLTFFHTLVDIDYCLFQRVRPRLKRLQSIFDKACELHLQY